MSIAKYICRRNPDCNLLGKHAYDQAINDQWIAWAQNTLFDPLHQAYFPLFGFMPTDMNKFNAVMKSVKELSKKLNVFMKNREWIGGSEMSVADIYLGSVFSTLFQTLFDPGFRKAMSNLTAWFQKVSSHPAFIRRFGKIRMCDKPLKPMDAKHFKPPAPATQTKKDKKEE